MSKKRVKHSYTIEDYYNSYKDYISDNPIYNISKKQYSDLLKDYFKFLALELIDKAKEVRLPARMGTLTVIKTKPKRYDFTYLRVDFNETKNSDKTILHLNEHSDGFNFRFFWSKRDIILDQKSLYELVMSRANKRHLAHVIKTKQKDYIEK
jgi:Tfp pilus assembly protein PilZ